MRATIVTIGTILLGGLLAATRPPVQAGQLEIRIQDAGTGTLVAARMHLRNAKGKPVKPPRVPAWHDHFAVDGRILLDLPNGNYEFEIERGPEYKVMSGYFTIATGANDSKLVELRRHAVLSSSDAQFVRAHSISSFALQPRRELLAVY